MVEAMWAGILLAVLAAGELTDERDSQPPSPPCPTSDQVNSELSRLGAVGVAPPEIAIHGEHMTVVLHRRDGGVLGSREVDAPAGCSERATVAAVVVASWMGIWPEGAPIEKRATPSATIAEATSAPPSRWRGRNELGLALLGAYDGNASALGIALELRRELAAPLSAVVAVSVTTERERTVAPGKAGYLRPVLEVGPSLRTGRGRLDVEIAVAARLGLLVLRGHDLPVNHHAVHVDPGVGASLHGVLAREGLSPFVVAGGGYWLARQEVTIDYGEAKALLPRWDFMAGVGCLWGSTRKVSAVAVTRDGLHHVVR